MTFFVHAPNIHGGGGKTLLLALIENLQQPAILQLDERLNDLPELSSEVKVIKVAPNIFSRFMAEFRLNKICDSETVLLCFGNLPPLFNSKAKVFVYLQNRYLVEPKLLRFTPPRLWIRLSIERVWLYLFLRKARILVQTETMKNLVNKNLRRDALIEPFLPVFSKEKVKKSIKGFDYIYVASGEPHKNHRRLIYAWILLSSMDHRPSLRLTLDRNKELKLVSWIEQKTAEHNLNVAFSSYSHGKISSFLHNSNNVLIYPSLFESFGLPLLEAKQLDIPIIAAEKDYVRDIINPTESFDPLSVRSIARAVLRFEGVNELLPLQSTTDFLKKIKKVI